MPAGGAGGNSLSGTAIDVTGMCSLPRHCQANVDYIATHYDSSPCHGHTNMQFYDRYKPIAMEAMFHPLSDIIQGYQNSDTWSHRVSNVLSRRYLDRANVNAFVAQFSLRCGGRSEHAEPIKGELKGSCFQTPYCLLDDKKSSDFTAPLVVHDVCAASAARYINADPQSDICHQAIRLYCIV
jgi:hypothetical protein